MNLLQLRTESRRRVAETSPTSSYSTDADFNAYINEGIKDMCVKGRAYEKTESTLFTSGNANYTLPLDFLSLRALTNPQGVALDPIEPGGRGRVYVVSGKPLYYFISNVALEMVTREDSHSYPLGTILLPITANGYFYEVVSGGVSGGVPPTYPLVYGAEVVDGTTTLLCREMAKTGYSLTLVDTPTTEGGGTGEYTATFYALAKGLVSDTDAPEFPSEKHHILVSYACFRHFGKMKDMSRAGALYTEYASALGLNPPGQG